MGKRKKRKSRRLPLSEIQLIAIEMLTYKRGENYEDVAKTLRISVRTLYRWRQREDFDKALADAVERRFRPLRRKWTLSQCLSDIDSLTKIVGYYSDL